MHYYFVIQIVALIWGSVFCIVLQTVTETGEEKRFFCFGGKAM